MDSGFPVVTVAIVILVIYLLSAIKILADTKRGVIFRLGRLQATRRASPHLSYSRPRSTAIVRVSLRQEALKYPPVVLGWNLNGVSE